MPGYYTYLMSSLPMLHFGAKPPFSFDRFLRMCESIVSEEDIDIVKAFTRVGDYDYEKGQATAEKWHTFDRTLRNELVKIRASRKKVDPLKYMRGEGYAEPSITHIAIHAHRDPSILEAERVLDQERWRFLEELAVGHYFDIDSLIIYANKLLILEQWDRINTADKSSMIENMMKQNSD